MGMFCYQCQETGRGTGCEYGGVCGKSEELAGLQDLLIYTIKGISEVVVKGAFDIKSLKEVNHQVIKSLFMTITNANFDEEVTAKQIKLLISLRNKLRNDIKEENLQAPIRFHDAVVFEVNSLKEMLFKASYVGVIGKENEDITSLKQLITYGVKGMTAYVHHASNLGKEDAEINAFIYEALATVLQEEISADELLGLAMKTGEFGVKAMALLDGGNTSRFGNPEITEVNIGVRKNPGILISGHDLTDLEQLLEQTKNTGIDVYTHSEMLPAHYYPAFKKYDNFVGNYGNAWWKQETEFKSFKGPILFTTNCIVPTTDEEIRGRIFTTGASGYPGCRHIETDSAGRKDFSEIIQMAKKLSPPTEIERGKIIGGFAHNQVFAIADKVVEAVKTGAIKKFFVMAGCDGRMDSREYYTEFAKKLPEDTVILTAGCAKYRYNKLGLKDINGIPRVLDAGQCNDSYSLVLIALKLKEIFGLEDVNQLPIAYNISWYEQKAVIVLLALLHLGVRNIHLGPTLPAFLSPKVTEILVENFGIGGIQNPEADIEMFMNDSSS